MADHGCPRLGQDLGGPSPRVEEEEQHGFIAEPGPLTIASGPEQCGDLRWVKCGLDECRRLRWLDPRKRVFGREILGVKPGAERPQGAVMLLTEVGVSGWPSALGRLPRWAR